VVQLEGPPFALGERVSERERGARRDGQKEDRRYLEEMRARQISPSSPASRRIRLWWPPQASPLLVGVTPSAATADRWSRAHVVLLLAAEGEGEGGGRVR
jgi:hypothetical protein